MLPHADIYKATFSTVAGSTDPKNMSLRTTKSLDRPLKLLKRLLPKSSLPNPNLATPGESLMKSPTLKTVQRSLRLNTISDSKSLDPRLSPLTLVTFLLLFVGPTILESPSELDEQRGRLLKKLPRRRRLREKRARREERWRNG